MTAYFTSTMVMVLGMHRSGTSAVTRLTGGLGASLPADPNPPAPDNIEGYWEPAGVVRLNDQLLTAADSAWLDTRELDLRRVPSVPLRQFRADLAGALETSFGGSRCAVLKDPRICRMVPFYRELLFERGAGLKVVLVLRQPDAVAASLHRRNQISPLYSGLLWAHHLLEAERHTRDLPRVIVDYDELLQDWRVAARRIGALLGLDDTAADAIDAHALPRHELRHHFGTLETMSGTSLSALLTRLYDTLLTLRMDDTAGRREVLDSLRTELAELAHPLADVVTAEFCFQRLTSPYDAVAPLDPARERIELAAAFSRIQENRLLDGQGAPTEVDSSPFDLGRFP